MSLKQYSTAITTTGSAGSATGSATINVTLHGYLEYIYLDYHASAPATTDVTVAYGATPPGGNILVATNNATDTLYWPRAKPVDNAGAAITDAYDRFPVAGAISISVAQSDALTVCVTAYLGVWI